MKQELKEKLETCVRNGELLHWRWSQTQTQRIEAYLVGQGKSCLADKKRQVSDQKRYLTVVVPLDGSSQGVYSGEVNESREASALVSDFITKAKVSQEKIWPIPSNKELDIPNVKSFDPKVIENPAAVANEFVKRIEKSVAEIQAAQFNSGEIFVTASETYILASNGFSEVKKSSTCYAEVCFSSHKSRDHDSQEFVVTKWAVHPDQINIKDMCERSVEGANQLAIAEKMPTGQFNVIVDSEVLAHIYEDVVSQLNIKRKYLSLPFIASGDKIVDSEDASYNISLDPTIPYGLQTSVFDRWGVEQKPLTLVTDNRVIHNIVDNQYGHYLGKVANTSVGNIKLESRNSVSVKELRKKSGTVIEVLQLSGLFTDPNSLTFSSEIRLAKIYDNSTGKIFYAKGGNLSGSFKRN
ncbi:MAG: metallopeptidase TldD-related protein [Bdellovibrionales bacterium]